MRETGGSSWLKGDIDLGDQRRVAQGLLDADVKGATVIDAVQKATPASGVKRFGYFLMFFWHWDLSTI